VPRSDRVGIPSEAQLIVPKVRPLLFDSNPVICLAGKTGAGKSVIARYLSVFYGFEWIHTRDLIRELLLEDIDAAPSKKLFHQKVDRTAISEQDLREFGAMILDVHKQAPVRKRLTQTIKRYVDVPTVVDSIRDTVDVDFSALGQRPAVTWFVDCDDSIIQHRLATKMKLGDKRLKAGSPVDRTALSIRHTADRIIPNNGSLEELRWQVDNRLFEKLIIVNY
jgi:dephospho-CoA kinase